MSNDSSKIEQNKNQILDIYNQIIYATVPEEIQTSLYALKVDRNNKRRRREFPSDINYRTIVCVQEGIYEITCNCCGKKEIVKQSEIDRRVKITIEDCVINNEKFIYYCEKCKPRKGKINCEDCKMSSLCPLFDPSRDYNSFIKGVGCLTIHNAKINSSKTCKECENKNDCKYYDKTREINYFAGNMCML